ncbi:MAG TPA: long-chain-fatty-acid--CoA ligase, partial [Quisquiliibacterium sp.]|nr:long-chain-fatty-acid--CoA ligase [Quisquiliibacterium sp.]
MLVSDIPVLAAHRAPAASRLYFEGRSRGYAELRERCALLAAALGQVAQRGDRIALLSQNRIEYLECYYGVPAAGMLLTLLNTRLSIRELAYILNDAEPVMLIVEPQYLAQARELLGLVPSLRRVVVLGDAPDGMLAYEALLERGRGAPPPPRPHESEPAWLLYTSGTTGHPKGVPLTHRNLIAGMLNLMCGFEHEADDVSLFLFPAFHVAGYGLGALLLRGRPVVILRGFEAGAYFDAVERYKVTTHAIAPTMLAMLLDHPRATADALGSVRHMTYGSSAMPPETMRRAFERWPQLGFGTAYGMTELSGNVTYYSRADHVHALEHGHDLLASCGREMPLARIRIVDAENRDVAPGQAGEILVKGDQVFGGYWRNEQANRESFTDGWFHTGDVGRFDEDRRLYIVDRKKDMIISGGENVYSREVEDALCLHPSVAEVAVVGAPDAKWGETVVGVIRLREGAAGDEAALDAWCRERLAGYKRPRRYVFVDELPKTASGKVQKAS